MSTKEAAELAESVRALAEAIHEQAKSISLLAQSNHALVDVVQIQSQELIDAAQAVEDEVESEFLDPADDPSIH